MARRSKSKTSIKLDLSNVGESFRADEEYHVKVSECTLEEGTNAPYFKLKFVGVDKEFEKSAMYHNASTSESSLWRLRPLMEALGMDIPNGPMEVDAEDFIGRECMCSTFKDTYQGGSSVKPDEFWPVDGDDSKGSAKGDSEDEIDLDEIDDDDIKKIAKELGIKGRKADVLREAIAEKDDDEIREAAEAAGVDIDGEEEEEEPQKKSGGKSKKVSSDDIQGMSEDDLEELIEEHELDVDLDDYRTLKKKRNAVIDALEEGDLIED